jgi:hypothetical protein
MHKACTAVPHAYGLGRGLSNVNKMEEVIKWLIKDLKFLHPNINIKVSVYIEQKLSLTSVQGHDM